MLVENDREGARRTLRERAGLVGADVGDGAERLERVELADDDVALDHGLGAAGERDGEDDDERGRDHREGGRDGVAAR